MRQFKSGILLKERVYVPDHDHHTGMLEELGIPDTSRSPNHVRFELVPPSGDPFVAVSEWKFIIDQDFLPAWFAPEYEEKRARDAVQKWANEHIFIGVDGLKLNSGSGYYLKDRTNITLSGSATVRNMWDRSTVQDMWDSSTVQDMWGSSTVQDMWGSSTVQDMWGSSTVRNMWDSSTVRSSLYHASVNPESLVLCNNATFADLATKTIYHSGNWKLVTVASKEVDE